MRDPREHRSTIAERSDSYWYREMTGYHWFVLLVAALGWMFDCLDQQLFALGRNSAMVELLRGITLEQYADFSTRDQNGCGKRGEQCVASAIIGFCGNPFEANRTSCVLAN